MKLCLFIFLTTVLNLHVWANPKKPMSVKKALRIDLWYNGLSDNYSKVSNHKKRLQIPARQKHLWECLERFEQKV